jgi:predicted nucleic acid-binding protein
MKYREPLFSVHGNEGRLAIYLEEQEAVLDLIEETGKEVHPDYIADLAVYGKVQNIRTEEGFDTYSKHRDKLDPTVLMIAMMSEDEALTLAEQILITVRAMREPATPRLEIVK